MQDFRAQPKYLIYHPTLPQVQNKLIKPELHIPDDLSNMSVEKPEKFHTKEH